MPGLQHARAWYGRHSHQTDHTAEQLLCPTARNPSGSVSKGPVFVYNEWVPHGERNCNTAESLPLFMTLVQQRLRQACHPIEASDSCPGHCSGNSMPLGPYRSR